MSLAMQVYLAAALGLASHLGFFIRGEHHIHAARTLRCYLLLAVLVLCMEMTLLPGEFGKALMSASTIIFTYVAVLFVTIFTYRVFFHPLRLLPGPRMAAVSKFWNVVKAADSSNYRLMEQMRKKYGDFVRTGMIDTPPSGNL